VVFNFFFSANGFLFSTDSGTPKKMHSASY